MSLDISSNPAILLGRQANLKKGTAVTVVEEGYTFDPYRPSQVDWFVYDRIFRIQESASTTLWFGAPYFGGSEPGWYSQAYGHVSAMIFPGSPSRGPLEIVKEAVQVVKYEISSTPMFSQTRLITFKNPTDDTIMFICRGISAPTFGGRVERQSTPPSPPTREMNLLVLHDDQEGRIIAGGERQVIQGNLAPCGFVPDEGQRVAEVPVPEDILRLGLSEVYENYMVDVEAEQPTLKRKPQ